MFLNDMMQLQKELDYMFGHEPFHHSTFSRGIFPAINIFEKNDGLVIKAELPAINKEDLEIELEGDSLTLSGKRHFSTQEGVVYHRREREQGAFKRKVKLPYRVDREKVSAVLEKGILTINLEKDERDCSRKITVK